MQQRGGLGEDWRAGREQEGGREEGRRKGRREGGRWEEEGGWGTLVY